MGVTIVSLIGVGLSLLTYYRKEPFSKAVAYGPILLSFALTLLICLIWLLFSEFLAFPAPGFLSILGCFGALIFISTFVASVRASRIMTGSQISEE